MAPRAGSDPAVSPARGGRGARAGLERGVGLGGGLGNGREGRRRLPDHRAKGLQQRRAGRRPPDDDGHLRRPDRRPDRAAFRHPAERARREGSGHLADARHARDRVARHRARRRVRAGRRGRRPKAGRPVEPPDARDGGHRAAADLLGLRRHRRGRACPGARRGDEAPGRPHRPAPGRRDGERVDGRAVGAPSHARRRRPRSDRRRDYRSGSHRGHPRRARGPQDYRRLGLERLFRDIQGARYHQVREPAQALYAGRLALGLDVND
jgi:hypothetical protein